MNQGWQKLVGRRCTSSRTDGTALVPASQYQQQYQRVWRRLVQMARLCCGMPGYGNYVRHLLERHPERPVPDYATFSRQRQDARYGGGGFGCC